MSSNGIAALVAWAAIAAACSSEPLTGVYALTWASGPPPQWPTDVVVRADRAGALLWSGARADTPTVAVSAGAGRLRVTAADAATLVGRRVYGSGQLRSDGRVDWRAFDAWLTLDDASATATVEVAEQVFGAPDAPSCEGDARWAATYARFEATLTRESDEPALEACGVACGCSLVP